MNEDMISAIVLFGTAIAMFIIGRTRKQENDRTVLMWMAVAVAIAAGVNFSTIQSQAVRLQWILAALPSLMLASHGAFLYYVRSEQVPKATPENQRRVASILARSDGHGQQLDYSRMLEAGERYFSAQALLLRYGGPAVILLGLSLTIANALMRWEMHHFYYAKGCDKGWSAACAIIQASANTPPRIESAAVVFLPQDSVVGAIYGLIGAYSYVLLYLGKRSFRMDITPGAATWCAVTMGVGPVLGGFIGLFAKAATLEAGSDWGLVGVLFLAGFAPRFIVESLEEAGRRVFASPSRDALPTRTLPLSQVRGMSRASQERLEEEGIDDATQLAMADPYRLLRNTSFDKRQILRWMDSAQLMTHLPESFSALERRGVRGAMNLTWFARESNQEALKVLAADVRMDETLLRSVARQLASDRQQALIRILYMLEEEGDSEKPASDDKPGDSQPRLVS